MRLNCNTKSIQLSSCGVCILAHRVHIARKDSRAEDSAAEIRCNRDDIELYSV